MVPTGGTTDHVTAVLPVPVTDAVNCCVPPVWTEAVVGDIEIVIPDAAGASVTVTLAVAEGFTTLVAVTVTVLELLIEEGAVYNPFALMDPSEGETLHVRAVLTAPVADAVNCSNSDGPSVTEPLGLIVILTAGSTDRVALPVAAPCMVVAVTVAVCGTKTVDAVNRPAVVMVPSVAGLTDQVTPGMVAFCSLAVSWSVCPEVTLAVCGLTDTVTGGSSVTAAVAVLLLSNWLVAVRVTLCCAAIEDGAV